MYSVPNRILKKRKPQFLFPIYLFQLYSKDIKNDTFKEVLFFSYQMGFDIFNLVEGFLDKDFLVKMKFRKGTGKLQFHIFNSKFEKIKPKENGLVFF